MQVFRKYMNYIKDFLENTPEAIAMRELQEEASLQVVKDLASLVNEEPDETVQVDEVLVEVDSEVTRKTSKKK